jgi:uncharacterized protein
VRDLVLYLAKGIVRHPDQVQVDEEVGEASILLELVLHPDDADYLEAEDERLLGAMRRVVSAAGGRKKAVLELVTEEDESDGDDLSADLEESGDDDSSEDGSDDGSDDDSTAP